MVTVQSPNRPGDLNGQVCAGYKIIRLLGSGGMGQVWFARCTTMGGQPGAVKVLLKEATANGDALGRFENEVFAIGAIKDPNVVRAYAAGDLEDGRRFLVLEYCEGGSLESLLETKGQLSFELTFSIMAQAASALDAAHKIKIVHRDFKPANIFLEEIHERLIVKLGDFGVAKLMDEKVRASWVKSRTMQGSVLGTVAYMAPEQAVPDAGIDHRADIYAFGVVLYECLTGRRPYDGNYSEMVAIFAHGRPYQPPRELRPDIPPELEDAIVRCLRHDREARPQTIEEAIRLCARAFPPRSLGMIAPRFVEKSQDPSGVTFSEGVGPAASQYLRPAGATSLSDARTPPGLAAGTRPSAIGRLLAAFAAGAILGAGGLGLGWVASSSGTRSTDAQARDTTSLAPSTAQPPNAIMPAPSDAAIAVAPRETLATASAIDAGPANSNAAPSPIDATISSMPASAKPVATIDAPSAPVAPARDESVRVSKPPSPPEPSKGSSPAGTTTTAPPRVPSPTARPQRAPADDNPRQVVLHFIVRPFAEVTVDGQRVGTTPTETTVTTGVHHVLLEGHVDGVDKKAEFDIDVAKETTVTRTW